MKEPNFLFEKEIWLKGYKKIAGIDEVGRGSFAGSVVAGAVVFSSEIISKISSSIKINDSKKLNEKQRILADKWIKENCHAWGIGEASVSQINKHGIKKATEIAFRKAILKVNPDYLLIDAFYIPHVRRLRRKNQKPIIKGDTKSFSIAAASIIAKVYRDNKITRLGKNRKYSKYLWSKNKGYGTKDHINAIKKHGPSKLHRKDYIRKIISS